MIVLGIDPGTAALGYGTVERTGARLRLVDAGCFETPSTWGLPQRLLAIHRHVVEQIELHRPDIVAVERLFFSKNAQVAVLLNLEAPPRPDDAADAVAIAIWAANSERDGVAGAAPATRPVGALDRSAVTPAATGESSFDRAVREALQRERTARKVS